MSASLRCFFAFAMLVATLAHGQEAGTAKPELDTVEVRASKEKLGKEGYEAVHQRTAIATRMVRDLNDALAAHL
jgi:hypothetical protein